jgi:uncharacterized protein (TIGR01370 family)
MKTFKLAILALVLCMSWSACAPAVRPSPSPSPAPALRDRIKTIKNYTVYYGKGRVADLARYDLAIVQPDTLSQAELAQLKAKGTLVAVYLSIGEVELTRPWYIDGRADPRWILGKNENWGSYFIDARQVGWQKLMVSLAGEYIAKGFDGLFLDTVDTVSVYPETRPGMLATIQALRAAYPQALIIQNRGFNLVEEVAGALDAVMFEDVSTSYNFEKKEYLYADNSAEILNMVDIHNRTGLPVLGLDYVPADNPGMAAHAVKIARRYGFIPAVSVIDLDDLPDYHIDESGPADLRVTSIRVEGDDKKVKLFVRIQNVGLSDATDIPVTLSIAGKEVAGIKATFSPGDSFDWQVPWENPQENAVVSVAVDIQDPTPADNKLDWVFSSAAIVMEPILPFDQQKHRPTSNGPQLTASYMSTPPAIDGDLSEWKNLPCIDLNTREQVSFGEPAAWGGPDDLSARACYGWDKENIYIGFNINDDLIVQKYTGANLWKGDHVELWFDTQLQLDFDSNEAGDDDFQLGISPGDFKDVPPDFVIFAPNTPLEQYSQLVEYKVVRTGKGYAGEIKIPASVLKGLRLAPGQSIGVTFEPSDTDTPGGSEQEMMLSTAPQSSSHWGNPTLWNNLTFSGQP